MTLLAYRPLTRGRKAADEEREPGDDNPGSLDWALAALALVALIYPRSAAAPGRTATLAGFLLGTVSGSGVATTVTLGSVAWPVLRRAGYPPDPGGGILSAAGIGAILSPLTLGKGSSLIVGAAGGSLVLAASYSAVAVLLLGLAVPVTASFIISAVIVGPALVELGVGEEAADMFIFYYVIALRVLEAAGLDPDRDLARQQLGVGETCRRSRTAP